MAAPYMLEEVVGPYTFRVSANGRTKVAFHSYLTAELLPNTTPTPHITDDVILASAEHRVKLLSQLPLEHRADAEKALKRLAAGVDAARLSGSAKDDEDEEPALFPEIEPWPESVKADELLTTLAEMFSGFLVMPEASREALALFVIYTYAYDCFDVSPLLAISSPEKRCGKSTLLDVLSALVSRPLGASHLTAAVVYRVVDAFHPTLMIDEADTFMDDRGELRGVLNLGWTRNMALVPRCEPDEKNGFRVKLFSVWSPKIIARIGTLPDTLEDRSIMVQMQRKLPSERTRKYRRDRTPRELLPLAQKAKRWVWDHEDKLREMDPLAPASLNDRAQDNWRPLLAIADLAGGEWPERARRAALALSGAREETQSKSVELLTAFHALFEDRNHQHVSTDDARKYFNGLDDGPWAGWSHGKGLQPTDISKLLRRFGIKSKSVRIGNATPKGYEAEQFKEAWARYLPSPGSKSRNTATSVTPQRLTSSPEPQHVLSMLRPDSEDKSLQDNECCGVAAPDPPTRQKTLFESEVL